MIYLNNAATSYPKPECVIEAVKSCLGGLPAGQLRSASYESCDVLNGCREKLARLLGISEYKNIHFTSGATEAANAVINGIEWKRGRAVVTAAEHNSILRPLYNLAGGLDVAVVPCDEKGYVDADELYREAEKGCDAVFVNHCSNVTGAVQDIKSLADAAHRAGALFITDVSQSAGCLSVNCDGCGADMLIFTGHKSLLGPQGTGGFYVRSPEKLRPYKFGGTGFDSAKLRYRLDGDQEFEAGTQNLPGIAGLAAAVEYVGGVGIKEIMRRESGLIDALEAGLSVIEGVRVYCGKKGARGPLLSFNIEGLEPGDVAYMLSDIYGIITRAGLQCAPLIHESIGSGKRGVVRASVSYRNTDSDVAALLDAVRQIAKARR